MVPKYLGFLSSVLGHSKHVPYDLAMVSLNTYYPQFRDPLIDNPALDCSYIGFLKFTIVVSKHAGPRYHGSFARTFYSEHISEIIAKLSQKYHFYLVTT